MSDVETTSCTPWADALAAIELFAVCPAGVGGIVVRARCGPVRDQLVARLRSLMPASDPLVRVPHHVTEDRLLGGLSLAATLQTGEARVERGVLAAADGGAVIVSMAERLEPGSAAQLCAALDRAEVSLERDGLSRRLPARMGVVALDEGEGDESTSGALCDRLAFWLELRELTPREASVALHDSVAFDRQFNSSRAATLARPLLAAARELSNATPSLAGADSAEAELEPGDGARIERARVLLPRVIIDDAALDALCEVALELGIDSPRGVLLAAAAARAHAALAGRSLVEAEDLELAGRLVLGPRARCMPADASELATQLEPPATPPANSAEPPPPAADSGEPSQDTPSDTPPERTGMPEQPLADVILASVKSGIAAGLLETMPRERSTRAARSSAGSAGATCRSRQQGRPAGVVAAAPAPGDRLNVVETLRACAPYQRLRGRTSGSGRIQIRKSDFRITRFVNHTETTVVFCVDASGSAAMERLAEAKGAVEQVLADCYARRDQVALIAFRGHSAAVLLEPTRSLARVRRSLAQLAGGGTTPLAAGIDLTLKLALEARRRGRMPIAVLMSDGRGNVSRDGTEGSVPGTRDAIASAEALRAAGISALFLDTATRPRPQSAQLSDALGARYLPLPYVDAAGISRQVQSLVGSAA